MDILRNHDNNITLICYQDEAETLDTNIRQYFHNVINGAPKPSSIGNRP